MAGHRKVLQIILQGAWWPRARKAQANLAVDSNCKLCNLPEEDDPLHACWTCPVVRAAEHPDVQRTN
eukprot:3560387-Prorocentrum_lima.AAC.1